MRVIVVAVAAAIAIVQQNRAVRPSDPSFILVLIRARRPAPSSTVAPTRARRPTPTSTVAPIRTRHLTPNLARTRVAARPRLPLRAPRRPGLRAEWGLSPLARLGSSRKYKLGTALAQLPIDDSTTGRRDKSIWLRWTGSRRTAPLGRQCESRRARLLVIRCSDSAATI